jgi:proteasome lid subunit RPN8/RPN11/TusA-related sulfurtransferase
LVFGDGEIAAMYQHARADFPAECCGILLGPATAPSAVSEVVPIPNVQDRLHVEDPSQYPRDARTAYSMDPAAQVRALREAEGRGLVLRGFYHSHPDHGVYFSEEDRRLAAPWGEPLFEGIAYVVISVTSEAVTGASQFVWSTEDSDYVEAPIDSPGRESADSSSEQGVDEQPSRRIVARGQAAPQALIAVRDGVRLMEAGELLEVLIDLDSTTEDGILGYCEKRGFPYWIERLAPGQGSSVRIRKPT